MRRTYNINFKKLAMMMLPPALRSGSVTAFAYLMMRPIEMMHVSLSDYMNKTEYTLTHNGQTCYLRAILNDAFDPELRGIKVEDAGMEEGLVIYHRERHIIKTLYRRDSERYISCMLVRRELSSSAGYDFAVRAPERLGLTETQILQLTALVNLYKIASKRFYITIY